MSEAEKLGRPVKYSEEQVTLFAELVRDAKCTSDIVTELTGIPLGSMGGIAKRAGVTFAKVKENRIRRARRVALVRGQYGEKIAKLFPRD